MTLHGRVLAPAIILAGVLAVVAGALVGGPWGLAELVAGVVGVSLGGSLWRYQERQRRAGAPD